MHFGDFIEILLDVCVCAFMSKCAQPTVIHMYIASQSEGSGCSADLNNMKSTSLPESSEISKVGLAGIDRMRLLRFFL